MSSSCPDCSPVAIMYPTIEGNTPEACSGAPGALDSETELARADGSVARVHRRVVPIGGLGTGRHGVACYLVLLRSRSDEHRAEQERDGLLAELRATLEATADGILVTDIARRRAAGSAWTAAGNARSWAAAGMHTATTSRTATLWRISMVRGPLRCGFARVILQEDQ